MRPASLAGTVTIIAATLCAPELRAADITGSISISAFDAAVNTGTFATMTSFTPSDPSILTETGVYTGAPLLTPVSFNTLQFDPPPSDVPVWSFTVGNQAYTFDVTSMNADYNSGLHQWGLGGDGIAAVSGYDPTPATWTLDLNQNGGAVVFDALADNQAGAPNPAAVIPEGSSLALMSMGLVMVATVAARRQTAAN